MILKMRANNRIEPIMNTWFIAAELLLFADESLELFLIDFQSLALRKFYRHTDVTESDRWNCWDRMHFGR